MVADLRGLTNAHSAEEFPAFFHSIISLKAAQKSNTSVHGSTSPAHTPEGQHNLAAGF